MKIRSLIVFFVAGIAACGSADELEPPPPTPPPPVDEANQAPIAAVADQMVLIGSTVTLSGDTSSDPDGDALQYRWNIRSRPPLSDAQLAADNASTARFEADRAGIFVVDLVVHDGQLDSAPATAIIAVLATEDAPMAYTGPDRTVRIGADVFVTGVYSTDPNGFPLLYSWSLVSKPDGSAAELADAVSDTIHITADVIGDYEVELTVHNGSHPSAPDRMIITAVEPDTVIPGDVPNGVFNPDEVYIFGTLSEGACYRDSIAHWSDPDTAVVGFDCYANERAARIRPDGVLLYYNTFEDILREFHCDDCPQWMPGMAYPTNVLANDTIIATPPCDMTGISGFIVGVTGQTLHRCSGEWYNEGGVMLTLTQTPLSFGFDNKVLTEDAIVDVFTGSETMITGLPAGTTLTTRVAGPTSFWLARNVAAHTHLWRIEHTGVATLEGTYPDPPMDNTPSGSARLDASGDLFQEGRGPATFEDVIIYRNLNGLSEVVYTETTNPAVKLHISSLITGP